MKKILGYIKEERVEAEKLLEHIGNTIEIHGSIYKIRKMSDFAFVLLRTKREIIQCILSKEFTDFSIEKLVEESAVVVTGFVKKEERSKKGYELLIKSIEVLSEPEEQSAIVINNKKVDAQLTTLLDFRPITLRNEKERAIFKIQEGIVYGIREFLKIQKFTEIRTPKIVYAGAEGGANIFHLDYFGKEAYLAQSPQFYKQMMVGVYERVYEIAPVFRAEKHDTKRHLNEYTSIDLEMGYIDSFEEIMQMETKMLKEVFEYMELNYGEELDILNINLPVFNEIPSIKFSEAKKLVSEKYNRNIKDFDDFEPEEEKLLSEYIKKETGCDFVFVTSYPSKKRPFYAMEDPKNSEETLSFDLLFKGVEITTGGQRIHSYRQQIAKMKKRDMNPEEFETYLMIHKYGIPPHGGLGLGLERFTARLLDLENVRYSTLFPRDINRLIP